MSGTKAIYSGGGGADGYTGLLGDGWDKQPLQTGIAFIRDLLGYIFFIDETGGAVFRLPNWFALGNYVGDLATNAGYLPLPGFEQPYVVQPGDNWITVAALLGVTEAALLAANAVRGPGALIAGETLSVPAQPVTPTTTYVVQAGDNWVSVAAFFGITEAALLALNSARGGGALGVGDHLVVPTINPIITIDERVTITGLTSKLSSGNIREWDFVANANGLFGAVAGGFNPMTQIDAFLKMPQSGMRRVGIWTDQNFAQRDECQRMADMIAVAQAVTFRQDTVTITANPQIQIDDQVLIYERITGEGSIHYVNSIKSTLDHEKGTWNYQLQTNWLGDQTQSNWIIDRAQLSQNSNDWLDVMLLSRVPPSGLGS